MNNVDPQKLRSTAASFATGITVVATTNQGEVFGMTANSFVSISLVPPLVLFSVQEDAILLTNLRPKSNVGISILSDEQEAVSRHFAGDDDVKLRQEFEFIEGAPIWPESLAWFATEVDQLIPCGDHTLVVCRVVECGKRKGRPLLYYSGYGALVPED